MDMRKRMGGAVSLVTREHTAMRDDGMRCRCTSTPENHTASNANSAYRAMLTNSRHQLLKTTGGESNQEGGLAHTAVAHEEYLLERRQMQR